MGVFKQAERDHRHIAMDLLARREHSQRELINKLKIRGFEGEEVEAYLDRLAEKGLQSDQKFAESYIRMRTHVGYGGNKISQELNKRGISEEMAQQIYQDLELDWYQVALELWQKKYNQLPDNNLKLKAKQSRFMQYRGFNFDIINRIFKGDLGDDD